jgi:hypothetical protein
LYVFSPCWEYPAFFHLPATAYLSFKIWDQHSLPWNLPWVD